MNADGALSFLTPYWSGPEMMAIHLASIRRFHPASPILVSKRGGGRDEMEAHRAEFGIQYWIEECDYVDALLRLLDRCDTQFVCVAEHDTVLLASLHRLLAGLGDGRWDLVGMEERVRDSPDTATTRQPSVHGWFRFAPGQVSGPILMFDWRAFRQRWGLAGVRGRRGFGSWEYEYDHGIGQKLRRHKYLLPFHTSRYGMGNLLMDGEAGMVWHQWYGSHRERLPDGVPDAMNDGAALAAHARRGERAFLADYPDLDFSTLTPAWGPECDTRAEQRAAERAYPGAVARGITRARRWSTYGPAKAADRILARLDRWRRLQ